MKQQANTPRSLYVSTKSITLQRAVDGLHARAVALIARSKSFVSSSDTPQQQQSSSGSSLTVSGGRALLELYENVTQMYLSRLKHGLLPDKTKVPAPVVAMKKSSIHANTCRPPAASKLSLSAVQWDFQEGIVGGRLLHL
ncbi:unnamed protein product [Sphagnum troendelagicum]|uniref:Uncharacterized protein n=1 Tax=Sphagnum jensenii TaxID=128206 RepID=A0ABP0XNG9_9BRYO